MRFVATSLMVLCEAPDERIVATRQALWRKRMRGNKREWKRREDAPIEKYFSPSLRHWKRPQKANHFNVLFRFRFFFFYSVNLLIKCRETNSKWSQMPIRTMVTRWTNQNSKEMHVKGLKRGKTLDLIVVIGLSFASNWLRRWREFSWPIRAKYIKTTANSENLRQINALSPNSVPESNFGTK